MTRINIENLKWVASQMYECFFNLITGLSCIPGIPSYRCAIMNVILYFHIKEHASLPICLFQAVNLKQDTLEETKMVSHLGVLAAILLICLWRGTESKYVATATCSVIWCVFNWLNNSYYARMISLCPPSLPLCPEHRAMRILVLFIIDKDDEWNSVTASHQNNGQSCLRIRYRGN